MSRIRARRVICVVVSLCVLGTIPAQVSGSVSQLRPADARLTGRVSGVAWNADSTPIAGAKIRLRNLSTGTIEATGVATREGEFTFDGVTPAAYVIELVDDAGHVRAVGQRFHVEAGATVATFVRLPASKPRFAGFFSNAALAAIAVASAAGVTAIGSNAPPASPQ
jgi:hypothetical protein